MAIFFLVTALLLLPKIGKAEDIEISGHMGADFRYFFHQPQHSKQNRNSGSLFVAPEFYRQLPNGSTFTAIPLVRFDAADRERSLVDLQELKYFHSGESFDLSIGVDKVFWGTTEFIHLIDIINQTDTVEDIDGEEKLGQPMIQATLPSQNGSLSFFLLPYFRERTFPGLDGRLRSIPAINTDKTRYESSAEKYHLDYALRYSHVFGDFDLGLAHFRGTSREPQLLPKIEGTQISLTPYYPQINQTSIDIQGVLGGWLLKMEGYYRQGFADAYAAGTGGFEYSFFRIFDSEIDLGVLGEFAYDSRGEEATSFAQKDLMGGLRFVLNDLPSTEILAGIIYDIDGNAKLMSLESSRRIGDTLKLSLEARFIVGADDDRILSSLSEDSFLRLTLFYYF